MTIELKRLVASDVDSFRELRMIALKNHPKVYLQVFEEESTRPRNFHVGMINDNIIVGAFYDGVLIAYTFLTVMPYTKLKHKGHVWGAYVKPEYRNHSLGKKMREWLFDEGRRIGLMSCHSSIVASNAATLAMHKAVGYIEMYTEKDGIKHPDGSYDDLIHLVKYL